MSGIFRIKIKNWSAVPRSAAEDLRISLDARGCLFWLLTRSDSWEIRVGHMQRSCGMSKLKWRRIRDELVKAGYLTVTKGKAVNGKIQWTFSIYSEPKLCALDKKFESKEVEVIPCM